MKKYYIESKCRICGNIHLFESMDAPDFNYSDFLSIVHEWILRPQLHECIHCQKYTIQDIVSHSKIMHGEVVDYEK